MQEMLNIAAKNSTSYTVQPSSYPEGGYKIVFLYANSKVITFDMLTTEDLNHYGFEVPN